MPSRTTVSWLNSFLVNRTRGGSSTSSGAGVLEGVMRTIVGKHNEVAFDCFFPVATNFGHSSPVRSITTLLLPMSVFVACCYCCFNVFHYQFHLMECFELHIN